MHRSSRTDDLPPKFDPAAVESRGFCSATEPPRANEDPPQSREARKEWASDRRLMTSVGRMEWPALKSSPIHSFSSAGRSCPRSLRDSRSAGPRQGPPQCSGGGAAGDLDLARIESL